jgi:hypothetical protein
MLRSRHEAKQPESEVLGKMMSGVLLGVTANRRPQRRSGRFAVLTLRQIGPLTTRENDQFESVRRRRFPPLSRSSNADSCAAAHLKANQETCVCPCRPPRSLRCGQLRFERELTVTARFFRRSLRSSETPRASDLQHAVHEERGRHQHRRPQPCVRPHQLERPRLPAQRVQ